MTKTTKVIITGGLGFIGINTAIRFIEEGIYVVIIDNMIRKGADINLQYLKDNYKGKFDFERVEICEWDDLAEAFQKHSDAKVVYHLAAQVAVTTSVEKPYYDFEVNAFGTVKVLECIREYAPHMKIIFSSTNKVYGGMEDKEIILKNNRYEYKDYPDGIDESTCLDFHSPYGCSKGCADQYIRDYYRIYGIKSVVLRQSCIYGIRQFGIEDQGWVSWFTIASLLNKPITIYGDGMQVRDVLFIDDLVDLYLLLLDDEKCNGEVFNVGGGDWYKMSLLELVDYLETIEKIDIKYSKADWRPGDQKIYVSDISKIKEYTGWKPKISALEGVERLSKWVKENKEMIKKVLG